MSLHEPQQLSPSQRRVATLAAQGHTNADIARTLHITTDTVEQHLTATYRKLNIPNRKELREALPVDQDHSCEDPPQASLRGEPRMTAEILAVPPQSGTVIHLHIPGYCPSNTNKRRALPDTASLCGIYVSRREHTPLAEALSWPHTPKECGCMRPGWRFCRSCIGHAVEIAGLAETVLAMVAKAGELATDSTQDRP